MLNGTKIDFSMLGTDSQILNFNLRYKEIYFVFGQPYWSALDTAPTSASAGAKEASNSTKSFVVVVVHQP